MQSHVLKLQILTIGKPRLPFARAGVEEYAPRLGPWGGVEMESLKAGTREQESAALLARSEGCLRVVLDERGEALTSRGLAAKITAWEQARHKRVAFLIGGADGHTDALRGKADFRWSLSPLTLQHEFALVLVLEQLYRARTLNAGLPYHRD